jgi:hypothetical protein
MIRDCAKNLAMRKCAFVENFSWKLNVI